MDIQEQDNEVVENKSSGIFSLSAALIKKLYPNSEQSSVDNDEYNEKLTDEHINDDKSEVSKSLIRLIDDTQNVFKQDISFNSIKNMAYEVTNDSESNHVLIALANVLNKVSKKFVIEKQDLLFKMPLALLEKFHFAKEYQDRSELLLEQCKKIQSVGDLSTCLQDVYELFYSVYQDTYADKEELEIFLFNIGAQVSLIGEKLHTVAEEQASDLKVQGELNLKMNDAVSLISENISSGNDLASLKNIVKDQLDTLQNIVEEERELVKAQEMRVNNSVKVLANRVNELKQEAQVLREKVQREKEHALLDPLTGIYNRQAYNEKVSELGMLAKKHGNKLSLSIWDIDHFKRFNDRYGHVVGDKVLKSVAEKLNSSLKDEYFLARYGGEEFSMLLPGLTAESAKEFADYVRNEVSNITFMVKGKKVQITVSCGIASIQDNDNAQSLFERADKALYSAKEEGRNRVNTYKP